MKKFFYFLVVFSIFSFLLFPFFTSYVFAGQYDSPYSYTSDSYYPEGGYGSTNLSDPREAPYPPPPNGNGTTTSSDSNYVQPGPYTYDSPYTSTTSTTSTSSTTTTGGVTSGGSSATGSTTGGEFCGNGSCGAGENCSSCASDCGNCQPATCGSCQGTQYCTGVIMNSFCNLLSCSPDPQCGGTTSSTGSTTTASTTSTASTTTSSNTSTSGTTGDVCGDSFCGVNESCSICSQDCGSCPVPTTPPQSSVIDGYVFVDSNGNSIFDAGEVGYVGASLSTTITARNGGGTSSVSSGSGGYFTFGTVAAGAPYSTTLSVPSGYFVTTGNNPKSGTVPTTGVRILFGIRTYASLTPTPGTCTGCKSWNGSACTDDNTKCTAGQVCSAGVCVVPTPTPTGPLVCVGCRTWNGAACLDDNTKCAAGQICTNGTCVGVTPTTPPAVTPTIAPSNIADGYVFLDANANGIFDSYEKGYTTSAAPITFFLTGRGTSVNTTSGANGYFSFGTITTGTAYQITLTIPSGYILTTANNNTTGAMPASGLRTLFGIKPTTATIVPTPTAVPTAAVCSGCKSWNGSVCVDDNLKCPVGYICSAGSCLVPTPTPPFCNNNGICEGIFGEGCSTCSDCGVCPTPTPTPAPVYSVSGTVLREVGGVCSSPLSVPLTLTDLSSSASQNTNSSGILGLYAFSTSATSNQLALTLPSGYRVSSVSYGTLNAPNSVTFSLPPGPPAINWCVTNVSPWFQTDVGDVRFYSFNNPVPQGQSISSDVNYPALIFSSGSDASKGEGNYSTKNWVVDDEFSYNNAPTGGLGTTAFSFYKSQVSKTNQTIQNLSDASYACSSSCNISSLPTGVYESPSNVTIQTSDPSNTISIPSPKRLIILSAGNITIKSNIKVSPGALLVVAAKGNIIIDPAVGNTDVTLNTSASSNLEGFFSSEGSIILDGNANCPSTPDKRLNVAGALIANALHPFALGGNGSLVNSRTLCTSDSLYPSLKVFTRPDFFTQLTDFYKSSSKSFREINP